MKMHALWWWIDRWRKSTAYMDMTLEQQGAYRNLLDEATLRGGPLPNDEQILAKACGDARKWRKLRGVLLARFELRADGWHNETLDEVYARSLKIAEERSAAGKAGNQRRWGDKRVANGIANPSQTASQTGSQTASPPDPDPDLRTLSKNKDTRVGGPTLALVQETLEKTKALSEQLAATKAEIHERLMELRASFEEFWSHYPNHKAKEPAWKAWQKLHPSSVLQDLIAAAVEAQKRSAQWQKDGGQFVPYAGSWLNQHRWDDDVAACVGPLLTADVQTYQEQQAEAWKRQS